MGRESHASPFLSKKRQAFSFSFCDLTPLRSHISSFPFFFFCCSIIGVIGQIDAHMLPDAKGWASMQRHLLGETDALRQQLRQQILGATNADLRVFAEVLRRFDAAAGVVVLGAEAAMTASGLPLEMVKVL